MSAIAPPLVAVEGSGGSDRLGCRFKQISWSAVTLGITAWCFTLGPVPGILACAVAKHVLVAIIVMGLGVDQRNRETAGQDGC